MSTEDQEDPLPPPDPESPASLDLFQAMRDISQDLNCTGWSWDLEFRLWEWVINPKDREERRRGRLLYFMANDAGGWWTHPYEAKDYVFVPLEEWRKAYESKPR